LPDQTIEPGEYKAFSDTVTGLVLPNSTAELRLVAPDGTVVSTTQAYTSPAENMAWAVIGTSWQYTNQPTPGAANVASLEDSEPVGDEEVSTLAPCPTGQYRNPDTNRCKLLATAASALTPCKEGQERNPETNRCRSVLSAVSSLVPCKENQERNPETNRCRAIESAEGTQKPCDEGEERNPDTNRCRKIPSAANSSGINKVKDVASAVAGKSVRWWVAGAAVLTALGYAVYEWRHDVVNYWHRRHVKNSGK
jgi:hypothetical protein